VLSHRTYQNKGICYVTKTFVARNKFPHVKVARNTKKVGQACIGQTSDKVFTESKATNRHQALARSQENILNQARNQLGTPGWAKSFLRGAEIFKLCPIISNYVQHIFQGGRKKF